MVARARIGVLLAAVAVTGCYDLERLDPGPESYFLLIDDFEDGDDEPSASQFSSWRADPFNADYEHIVVKVIPGGYSEYAFTGEFTFEYPGAKYSGMNLGVTGASLDPVDARVYESFHFSARAEPGDRPFPELTDFYVQLGCSDAPPKGLVKGPFWIQQNVELTSDWQTYELSLDAFSEPNHVPPAIKGGVPACRAVVDSVRLTVAMPLGAGESATGSLSIDDVYFK